jgi:hypothetical protein
MKTAAIHMTEGAKMVRLLTAALILFILPGTALAQPEEAEPFFGIYVGNAEVYDGDGNLLEQRDIDIEIAPGERSSLVITWINVSLVDGRRDVPGVERRLQRLTMVEDGDILVEDTRGSLFSGTRDIDTMEGDAIRWGRFQDSSLDVFAIGVLEDGRYRLHSYERRLTEEGLELEFNAWDDGVLVRRITGYAVRVE